METGLAGKPAVVTGVASGIGLTSSRALAAEGAFLSTAAHVAAVELAQPGITANAVGPVLAA